MNLGGLTALAAGTLFVRAKTGKTAALAAQQAASVNTLQNELLLLSSGNSQALTAYQKVTNTNLGNLVSGLGSLQTSVKNTQSSLSSLGQEIGAVQNNTTQNIKVINSQLQALSSQINAVSNNVNASSNNGGFFSFLGF